jgi:Sulfotransferase family
VKPHKVGSSSASGITLRIVRNIAKRYNTSYELCRTRFDHGPDTTPGKTLFRHRNRTLGGSFLWTIIRQPIPRILSSYYFFSVSRWKRPNTDKMFHRYMNDCRDQFQDYYYQLLHPNGQSVERNTTPSSTTTTNRTEMVISYTNEIYQHYDFIGITERMDESAVVLMMLLNLTIADILYLSTKSSGGYDDARNGLANCTYIQPTMITPGTIYSIQSMAR